MRRFRNDDLTFDVLDVGPRDGEPVVLLHGFPETSEQWREVARGLADQGCRVLTPDQRGYSPGAQPGDVRQYRIELLAGDVEALADAAGWDRFHVVGHDWGGMVAWYLAANRAERIDTVSVLSTPHPRALGESLRHSDQALRSSYVGFFRLPWISTRILEARDGVVLRTALERSGMSADDATEVVDRLLATGALSGALAWYRAARPGDARRVGTVRIPTLYVWSSGDSALGRDAAARTAKHVDAQYHFEVLDGVSHWMHRERPDEVSELVGAHLLATR